MEIWDIWPYLYTSFLLDSDTPPQTRWCMGGNVSQVWNHLDTSIYLLKDKQPGPNIEGNGLDDPQWPWHGKRPASVSCQVCLLISLPNPNEMIIWGLHFLSLAAFFHQATTNNHRSCQMELAGIRFLKRWRQNKITDVLVGDNLKYIMPRYRLICFSPPSWPIQSNIRTTWPEDDVSSRHIFHFLSSPLEFSPPARSSSHTLIVLTKTLKGDPSDQELEGLRSVLLPPQPQHLPPWLRRRLRLLRQDVQVGPRLQRLILGAPEKLWEGQRNSETQVSIHDAFYIFSWLKNSFINLFVEKWRLKGRFYYHLK